MQEMITVIVPVYNAAAYLQRCVESIRSQSFRNLEILLVDDGSTDDSGRLCRQFAAQDNRIRVIARQNGGVSSARNAGLEQARGKYISFVDADDWLEKDMLLRLWEDMERLDCQVAVCGFFSCASREDGDRMLREAAKKQASQAAGSCAERAEQAAESCTERAEQAAGSCAEEASKASGSCRAVDAKEYLQTYLLYGDTRCWSKLYLREAIRDVRFREDLSIGEDMLFFLEVLPRITKIARDEYQGYFYFDNAQGAMRGPFQDSYLDQIYCWQEARRRISRDQAKAWRRVNSILAISVMLVVGKLALLPAKERKARKEQLAFCRQTLAEALAEIVPQEDLDQSYRLKVRAFLWQPSLYLAGYGFLKRMGG